jgi:hypothetical protein
VRIRKWATANLWALLIVASLLSYPLMAIMMREQFAVYQIHPAPPATMLLLFFAAAYPVEKYAKKHWGKMGLKGWLLLLAVDILLTLLLKYGFGFQFRF